jgi:transposase InsO family protein
MEITGPNQVWAMDITYIPMASGFVYLAVVLDWATRRVLSWRLSTIASAGAARWSRTIDPRKALADAAAFLCVPGMNDSLEVEVLCPA